MAWQMGVSSVRITCMISRHSCALIMCEYQVPIICTADALGRYIWNDKLLVEFIETKDFLVQYSIITMTLRTGVCQFTFKIKDLVGGTVGICQGGALVPNWGDWKQYMIWTTNTCNVNFAESITLYKCIIVLTNYAHKHTVTTILTKRYSSFVAPDYVRFIVKWQSESMLSLYI